MSDSVGHVMALYSSLFIVLIDLIIYKYNMVKFQQIVFE